MMHKKYYLSQLEGPNKEFNFNNNRNENKLQEIMIQINKQEPLLKKIEQAIEQNISQIDELKEDKKDAL